MGRGRLGERLGEAGSHLAGADDEHFSPAKTALEPVGRERDRRLRERGGAPRDGRLGAHPLARLDGMAEEHAECLVRGVLMMGQLGRGTDLAEDLPFAEHRGVDAGRHFEKVRHGGVLDPAREVVRERPVLAGARARHEEVLDVGESVVEPLDHRVHLRAKAGGQHDCLGDVLAVAQHLERLGQVALCYRALLEDVQGDVSLVDPHRDNRHVTSFLPGESLWSQLSYKTASPGAVAASGWTM